jgi:hypothetical protein
MNETKKDMVAESIDVPKQEEIAGAKEVKKPSLIEEIEGILGGNTIVVNLSPLPVEDAIEEQAKSVVSDEWIKKMAKMTDGNQHNEVNIEKAKLLNATGYIKIFELIGKLTELERGMPSELANYNYYVIKEMEGFAKNKLSDEDYQKFARVG